MPGSGGTGSNDPNGGTSSSGTGSNGGTSSGGGGTGSAGSGGGMSSAPKASRNVLLAMNAAVVPDPAMRRADLPALHPKMRSAALELLRQSDEEGLEFRLFETFRSPFRQNWLFQQGRSVPNTSIVTNAAAWSSYHQYGLAADFVLFIQNKWSWETAGAMKRRWRRLHELGESLGLQPLSFEMPHLQVAGLNIAKLRAGKFPAGGDDSWRDNLEAAVITWNGVPAGPPVDGLRPAL